MAATGGHSVSDVMWRSFVVDAREVGRRGVKRPMLAADEHRVEAAIWAAFGHGRTGIEIGRHGDRRTLAATGGQSVSGVVWRRFVADARESGGVGSSGRWWP